MTDISTLAAETSRLLNFYQGAEAAIEQKIQQYQQAEIKHRYVYYVDAENGDNSNDGLTKDTAFRTIKANCTHCFSNGHIQYHLKNKNSSGQQLTYGPLPGVYTNSVVFVVAYSDDENDTFAVKPKIDQSSSYLFTDGRLRPRHASFHWNSFAWFSNVHLKTDNTPENQVRVPFCYITRGSTVYMANSYVDVGLSTLGSMSINSSFVTIGTEFYCDPLNFNQILGSANSVGVTSVHSNGVIFSGGYENRTNVLGSFIYVSPEFNDYGTLLTNLSS